MGKRKTQQVAIKIADKCDNETISGVFENLKALPTDEPSNLKIPTQISNATFVTTTQSILRNQKAPKNKKQKKTGLNKLYGAKFSPFHTDKTLQIQPWEQPVKQPRDGRDIALYRLLFNATTCLDVFDLYGCGCVNFSHTQHSWYCYDGPLELHCKAMRVKDTTRAVEGQCSTCSARTALRKHHKLNRKGFKREAEKKGGHMQFKGMY
jgi:hypothetical protein